ncbi:hypothetical protein [Carboxylicivirga sp. RSCT41]|uniref:hypothetical protein n=1 Tax=Carboxylicivirga agarovorans TaxID=3417570 RepID=UPI003D352A29
MKTLKSIFAVSLFIVGLSLTSCSSDDKYIEPDKPVHLPSDDRPTHPIEVEPSPF